MKTTAEKLRKLSLKTGSIACLGCGYENHCGTMGCAILRAGADELETALETVRILMENVKTAHEALEKAETQVRAAKPVLCARCGKFDSRDEHACDGCRWK